MIYYILPQCVIRLEEIIRGEYVVGEIFYDMTNIVYMGDHIYDINEITSDYKKVIKHIFEKLKV